MQMLVTSFKIGEPSIAHSCQDISYASPAGKMLCSPEFVLGVNSKGVLRCIFILLRKL